MKKFIVLMIIITVILLSAIGVNAASPTAALSGPSTVRSGDTITVTFRIGGSGILGASGELKYDSSKLTLTSTAQIIGSPWLVEFNNTAGTVKFIAYDNAQTTPVNSTKDLFSMTFKVNSLATGTNVEISTTKLEYTDGNTDVQPTNVKYSFSIAAPKSTNSFLQSLTVSNATLSPAFNKNTTSYTTTVPYSVSKLNISAVAEDSKATVAVNNPNLAVGSNDISIVVTAENGTKKTYTIKVTREQDPNYKPNSDARLSEITLSTGFLSPVFNSDRTDYIVFVPYETASIRISGKAKDSKGQNAAEKTFSLSVGDNKLTIAGTAEDGSKKEYTIHVFRMKEFDGKIPEFADTEDPIKVTISGKVSITGNASVGETITANAELSDSNATVTYTWYSGNDLVGQGQVYNVSKADVGKTITVRVTGTGTYEGEIISDGVEVKEEDKVEVTPSPTPEKPYDSKEDKKTSFAPFIIVAVFGILAGFALGFFIKKRSYR
jgi:predicted secreted protein